MGFPFFQGKNVRVLPFFQENFHEFCRFSKVWRPRESRPKRLKLVFALSTKSGNRIIAVLNVFEKRSPAERGREMKA